MTDKTPQGNEKSIGQVLEELVNEFAYKDDNGDYHGHDTNLGDMKEEFDQALKEIKSICEEVMGEPIVYEWISYNSTISDKEKSDIRNDPFFKEMYKKYPDYDFFERDYLVCSVCGQYKDDPECPHKCDVENMFINERRDKLNKLLEKE